MGDTYKAMADIPTGALLREATARTKALKAQYGKFAANKVFVVCRGCQQSFGTREIWRHKQEMFAAALKKLLSCKGGFPSDAVVTPCVSRRGVVRMLSTKVDGGELATKKVHGQVVYKKL